MSPIDLALGPSPAELAALADSVLLGLVAFLSVFALLVTPDFWDWLASLCLGAWRTLRRLFNPRCLKGRSQ